MEDADLPIPNLKLLEEIGRGAQSIVYRASRQSIPYAVKIFQGEEISVFRFQREAEVLARVHHPSLPAIKEVGKIQHRPYIVMDFIQGSTLAKLLEQGPLPEAQIIKLALTLAGALAEVHTRGLVHRDVKPRNIILTTSQEIKLIDFGLAAAKQTILTPEAEAVGTLLYSAPEQTGLLKRPVDGRSDLYALGCVLFECAAGQPPFNAPEASELIRRHLVSPVPDLKTRRPEISPALAAVITKLLAKDPDDRYQTGKGLATDLQQLTDLNTLLTQGQEVVLDAQAAYARTVFETPLIGRAAELDKLDRSWNKVVQGKGLVTLLEGETGSGKTRLVQEFLNNSLKTNTLVLTGKCSETDPLPFAPLRAVIENHLRGLAGLPHLEHQAQSAKLVGAAGEFAPLLKYFFPGLSQFLKEAAAIGDPTKAQEMFHEILAHFLLRLAGAYQGTVLFVDDVHWLDDSSRQVLRCLVEKMANVPFFIILSGRNDPANIKKLDYLVAALNSPLVSRLPLILLEETEVFAFLTAYLGSAEIESNLSRQIANRTNGNPLAMTEYVRALLNRGLLRPSWGNWLLDAQGLEGLALPSNILQLIISRLSELGEKNKSILSAAAVMGHHFSLNLLSVVCRLELEEIYGAIAEATKSKLIERLQGGEYGFIHDQIQAALLTELNPRQQQALHERLAQALDQTGGSGAEYLLNLARHYNLSGPSQNPRRVYEVNLAAGIAAFANYAPQEAYDLLSRANQLAKTASFPPEPKLLTALAEVCLQVGKLTESITHFKQAITQTQNPLDRANLQARLCWVYLADLNMTEASQVLEQAYVAIGKSYPRDTVSSLLKTVGEWFLGLCAEHLPFLYNSARGKKRLIHQTHTYLNSMATMLFYYQSRSTLGAQASFKSLLSVYLIGSTAQSINFYCTYAILMCLLFQPKHANIIITRALRQAQQMNDHYLLARCQLFNAYVRVYLGLDTEAATLLTSTLEEHGRWLDEGDYSNCVACLCNTFSMRGYAREALKWPLHDIEKLKAISNPSNITRSRLSYMHFSILSPLALLGRFTEAEASFNLVKDFLDQPAAFPSFYWGMFYQAVLIYYLEQGVLGEPLEKIINAHRLLKIPPRLADYPSRSFFVFKAYARFMQCLNARASNQPLPLDKLKQALQELRSAVANFATYQSYQLTLEAGLKELENQDTAAAALLTRAEEAADRADVPWALFEIRRIHARIFMKAGNRAAGLRQAWGAYNLALQHGWTNRAKQVKLEFPLPAFSAASFTFAAETPVTTDPASLKLQRYLDALLKVSLASSTTFETDQQIRAALDEIVKILGGERAFLFLCGGGGEELLLKAGRDAAGADLKELTGFSATIVEQVRKGKRPVVVSGTEQGPLTTTESIIAHGIRSIMAAPLFMQQKFLGVIYLDNRLSKGVFTPEDVDILLAIANHISIALEASRVAEKLARSEKLAALGKLGGAISHELRNPLGVINNSAYFLRLKLAENSDEKIKHHLDIISKEVGTASKIIEDILTFARIKMPQLAALEITQAVTDALAKQALPESIQLATMFSQGLPLILGDRGQLTQVFENLIQNACQAMPAGGKLSVAITASDHQLEVRIEDTGQGIAPENLDKIFEPLFTTKKTGTGLGLSICQSIIESHYGKIKITSKLNQGAVATVLLPGIM